jgi:hypothetical protein
MLLPPLSSSSSTFTTKLGAFSEMNRSFRATESQMRTALRQSQLEVFRSSSFVIDRDEELALFHQMKNCENENDDLLLRDSTEEFVDAAFGK